MNFFEISDDSSRFRNVSGGKYARQGLYWGK